MSESREIEIDEVQTIGAEVMLEMNRVQNLPAYSDPEEAFRRLARLLGIAALKALPLPSEHHVALLRRAMGEN